MVIFSNLVGSRSSSSSPFILGIGSSKSSLKNHTVVSRAVCGISLSSLKRSGGSMRCYCSSSSQKPSPLDPLLSVMRSLHEDVTPSVVALRSFFSAPEAGQLNHCSRAGAGVFVDRGLIVTSAHVVGKLSGSDVQSSCCIGRTFAITIGNQVVETKVLAVDFAGDVAVLGTEGDLLPPPCEVAASIAWKELPLIVITKDEGCDGGGMIQIKVRCFEDNSTNRSDWPYKVEDGFDWVRYGGAPVDEVKVVPGSPWFSIGRQVVGTASWPVGEEVVGSVGGFVAPPLRIKSVVDYAKRKGPRDPVVLDRWIDAVTFADYGDADVAKECLNNVGSGFVITMYLGY